MKHKNMFDLTDRVALVTAAGRGLGREFCIALAAFGADVVCSDIDIQKAEETAGLLKESGHRCMAIEADVSQPDHVQRMVNLTADRYGSIDILFNNAGIRNQPVRLHELSLEEWDRIMAVNLRGMFVVMRAVLRVMVQQQRGTIINTASVIGLMAGCEEYSLPNAAPYGIAKHGVIGLTKHAAVAYARDGIRINAIAPGPHRTWPSSVPKEQAEKIYKKISRSIPMGRVGEPDEIRGLAVYLASDASGYVTGATIVHDGGFTA